MLNAVASTDEKYFGLNSAGFKNDFDFFGVLGISIFMFWVFKIPFFGFNKGDGLGLLGDFGL